MNDTNVYRYGNYLFVRDRELIWRIRKSFVEKNPLASLGIDVGPGYWMGYQIIDASEEAPRNWLQKYWRAIRNRFAQAWLDIKSEVPNG